MKDKKKGLNTICTHEGGVVDEQFMGGVSPLYMSSSYAFENVDVKRYPRYFNTPNQQGLSQKIAALEHAEQALVFGSGMAAISTSLLSFLGTGDHVVLQRNLYGGTSNLISEEFRKYGISYSFTTGWEPMDFEAEVRENTKVIFIETPSNPLLTITDLGAIAEICKRRGLVSMIDNTFASPVNQNPIDFGIDIVIHSATKYMGGHSDICAGAVAGSRLHIDRIFSLAKNLGGSLSDYTVWLLERSIKTMGLRVRAQNENAQYVAEYLQAHADFDAVYYPGLPEHDGHELAKSQMHGFGGMLSFSFRRPLDADAFRKELLLIKSSMSLAGVESTMVSPALTSHALLSQKEREIQGISDRLIRFSVGIEDVADLIEDLEQALTRIKR
ncbi:MAG: PLP-dependent aspartate aminotransferase family protein [Bacteroidota bacterium]